MRGRPLLHVSYESDEALMPTATRKAALGVFLVLAVLVPLYAKIPILPDFLATSGWLKVLGQVLIFAVGALGLNLLTGLAGQVSLGHAFFMGVGAYTAAVLGAPKGTLAGMGLPIWIWLPAAGLVAAAVGVLVGPTAVRVRGLYLAIVTLGLVFIGDYLFRNLSYITGGTQSGRRFPPLELRLWKGDTAVLDFTTKGKWLGVELSGNAKTYLFLLAVTIVATLCAKNIQRTRVGRAFQAIRDRDVAAEVMGVNEVSYKLLAFGLSSFYAGVAGALLASFLGRMVPENWDLLLSVQFIAIILIGGAGTVSGALMGSAFVIALPRVVQMATDWTVGMIQTSHGLFARIADIFVATSQTDFGLVNTQPGVGPGLSVLQLNQVIYGLLIIGFLIFEPLGLYGIWLRIRNYWKGWPFTY